MYTRARRVGCAIDMIILWSAHLTSQCGFAVVSINNLGLEDEALTLINM